MKHRHTAMLAGATILLMAGWLLLAACAPAAQPGASAPASGPAAAQPPRGPSGGAPSGPGESGAPSAAAAAAPATASAVIAGVPADWEQQWNALIASARQEGTLILAGPPTSKLRTSLPARFRERFGVEVEYLAYPPNPGEFVNKLVREQAVGTGSVDAFMIGAQSIYTIAYPEKIMAPVRPQLIHPEVLDLARWTDSKLWFRDPDDTYFLQLTRAISGPLVVNAEYVRPEEIKAWNDLLDPKYTGRITAWDPTFPGTGWNQANWFRTALGDDYFKRLYVDQRVAIPADNRQWTDWVARGSYPIALGLGSRDIEALRGEGFQIAVLPGFPEAPGHVGGAFGILVLPKMAPHPAAAALFANWIAMREGQEVWGRAEEAPSLRTDLDNSWAPAYTIPVPGVQYHDDYAWDYVTTAFTDSLPKIKQVMAQR
jgi:iron(III) transport system substrate-binding protein